MKKSLLESKLYNLKNEIQKKVLLEDKNEDFATSLIRRAQSISKKPIETPKNKEDILSTVSDSIKNGAMNAYDTLSNFFKDFLKNIQLFFNNILRDTSKKGNKNDPWYIKLKNTIIKAYTYVKKQWNSILDGIMKHMPTTGIKLAMVGFMILAITILLVNMSGSGDVITKAIDKFMKTMKNVFNDLINGLTKVFRTIFDPTKLLNAVGDLVLKILAAPFEIISSIFNSIVSSGNISLMMLGLVIIGFGISLEYKIYTKATA